MKKILMMLMVSSIVGCGQHESVPQGYQVPANQVQTAPPSPQPTVVVQQPQTGTDPLLAGVAGFLVGNALAGKGSSSTNNTTNVTRNVIINRSVQINRTVPSTSRRR